MKIILFFMKSYNVNLSRGMMLILTVKWIYKHNDKWKNYYQGTDPKDSLVSCTIPDHWINSILHWFYHIHVLVVITLVPYFESVHFSI